MPSYPYSKHEIIGFEETLPPYHKQNDSSLRIISTQIRRIRGTCTYLSKNMNCPVLYEIYGRCVSKSEPFSNIPGLSFVLQENGHKQTVNCALYDFDEILPNIMVGNTYRCVGRYHCQKYVFQCFNVEELSENEVDLMESFQYQSNLELTELTRPNKSTKTSSRVSKTIWRPNSIANSSTINHPLEFRHLTVPTAKLL
ncbi:unnamed protein product [Heterobilharzia americana]|nr:unnamed protein product [Heterobilharzia americana]